MPEAVIGFGSNIDPDVHLRTALAALAGRGTGQRRSNLYETPPVGAPGAPPFLNGVIAIQLPLALASEVRELLRELEAAAGRQRGSEPNAPRTLDLDLLLWDGEMVSDPSLDAHVALPFSEICPDWVHPTTGEAMGMTLTRFATVIATFTRR